MMLTILSATLSIVDPIGHAPVTVPGAVVSDTAADAGEAPALFCALILKKYWVEADKPAMVAVSRVSPVATTTYVPVDDVERSTEYVVALATSSHVNTTLDDGAVDDNDTCTPVGASGGPATEMVAVASFDGSESPAGFDAMTLKV